MLRTHVFLLWQQAIMGDQMSQSSPSEYLTQARRPERAVTVVLFTRNIERWDQSRSSSLFFPVDFRVIWASLRPESPFEVVSSLVVLVPVLPLLPQMLWPPSIPFIALLLRPAPALMLMVIPRPHNPEVCSRQYNRSISATGKSVYGSGNGSSDSLRRMDPLPFPVLSSGKRWGLAFQCVGWSDGICLIPIACCLFNLFPR